MRPPHVWAQSGRSRRAQLHCLPLFHPRNPSAVFLLRRALPATPSACWTAIGAAHWRPDVPLVPTRRYASRIELPPGLLVDCNALHDLGRDRLFCRNLRVGSSLLRSSNPRRRGLLYRGGCSCSRRGCNCRRCRLRRCRFSRLCLHARLLDGQISRVQHIYTTHSEEARHHTAYQKADDNHRPRRLRFRWWHGHGHLRRRGRWHRGGH